eukprot:Opistho-1_new@81978
MPLMARPLTLSTAIGTSCLIVAWIMAVASVATPVWLTRDTMGLKSSLGLTVQCDESASGRSWCDEVKYADLPSCFRGTLVLLVLGIICLALTIVLSMSSMRRLQAMRPARYMGFVTSFFFALATLIFPGGFDSDYVGGKAFKLPEGTTVGYSYILFIMATLLVFVGELFAGKSSPDHLHFHAHHAHF